MKLLFFFPDDMTSEEREVIEGRSPSERMYGAAELRADGWQVEISNDRFRSRFKGMIRRLNSLGLNAIDLRSIGRIRQSDCVLYKDEFSLMAVIIARVMGRKFYFYDSMFILPTSTLRRVMSRACIFLASGTIAFSRHQSALWSESLRIPARKITPIPYAIDVAFYERHAATSRAANDSRPYVLAIGRDTGRDFRSLVLAMEGTGIDLCLVTLPYLLENVNWQQSWIRVLKYIPYEDLFELYRGATAVAVTLKDAYTYPSGVRAMLEGMVLQRPVIVTRTPALEEYATEKEVMFVEAGSVEQIRSAVVSVHNSDKGEMVERAAARVRRDFSMGAMVGALTEVIGHRAG